MKKFLLLFTLLIGSLCSVSAQKWVKVLSEDDLDLNAEYVVVCDEITSPVIMTNFYSSYMKSTTVTISNNEILTLPENTSIIKFIGEDWSSVKIMINGYYYTTTEAKKCSLTTSGTNASVKLQSDGKNVYPVISFGKLGILYYNSSSPRFLNYTSNQTKIQLYKFVAKVKEDVTLTWSAKECEVTMGEEMQLPTLTITPDDFDGTIEYSSKDTEVAYFDQNGKLVLKSAGETIITASFKGDDKYNAAEDALYRLTVNKPEILKPTFDTVSGTVPANTVIRLSAEEDAVIYYYAGITEANDESEYKEYNPETGIELTNPGTVYISAYAQKGEVRSDKVSAIYTVEKFERNLQWLHPVTEEPVTEFIYYINKEGDQRLPDPSCNMDTEDFTFESSNPAVLAIDEGGSYDPEGFAPGITTLTLKIGESDMFKADEASYDLIVVYDRLVAVPTFDPESGSEVALDSGINILTDEEGAEIYYRVVTPTISEDANFKLYKEGDVKFDKPGTYVVEAYAKVGDDVSKKVKATYTVAKGVRNLQWSLNGEPVTEVNYVIGGTKEEQQLPKRPDLTSDDYTVTSSNTAVATVGEYGEITVVGVGTTTITIVVHEDDNYKEGTSSYTLKVENNFPTFDFTTENPYGMTTYSGSAQDYAEETNIILRGVNLNISGKFRHWKGTSTIALRAYKGAVMTFTAPLGCVITKVTFDNNMSSFNASTGSVNKNTWTGIASELQFTTVSSFSSNKEIKKITVEFGKPTATALLKYDTADGDESKLNTLELCSIKILANDQTYAQDEIKSLTIWYGNIELGTAADGDHIRLLPTTGDEFTIRDAKGNILCTVDDLEWKHDAQGLIELVKVNYFIDSENENQLNADYIFSVSHPLVSFLRHVDSKELLEWTRPEEGADFNSGYFSHFVKNVGTYDPVTKESTVTLTTPIELEMVFPFAVHTRHQGMMALSDDNMFVHYATPSTPSTYSITPEAAAADFNVPGDVSGVSDVAVDADADVEYYNMQGVKIEGQPAPGMYIRRQGTTATKVTIK